MPWRNAILDPGPDCLIDFRFRGYIRISFATTIFLLMSYFYPSSPPENKIPPISNSPEFRQAAGRTTWAIALFAFTLLVLVAASVVICIGCIMLAVWMVRVGPSPLKGVLIGLALGLVLLGVA